MTTRKELTEAMTRCEQAPGYSVYEHCRDVARRYLGLLDIVHGREPDPSFGWVLPPWIHDPVLKAGLKISESSVLEYLLFHDCGKPACLQVGPDQRRHFPDHAFVSAEVWSEMRRNEIFSFPGRSSAIYEELEELAEIENLIRMDMDAHTLIPEAVPEFARRPEACTLLLAALAEIHANAVMFGGFESTSFKIKHKHLVRRGKQVLAEISRYEHGRAQG